MKKATITVCIVDDSLEVRESIGEYIASAPDFEWVGACKSGEEAVKVIPDLKPAVVLMDINLPGMSGLDLCRRLRADPEQAGLRVALFSQADQESDVQTGLEAGADHVLSKELLCAPDLLGRQLRTVLARPVPPAGDA